MRRFRVTQFQMLVMASMLLMGAGCTKKVALSPPTPPPPPRESTTTTASAASPARSSIAPSVTQTKPAPRYPDAGTQARINQLLTKLEDAYFEYDKATLSPDAVKALQSDSAELRDVLGKYPDYKLRIEGHCDERGSAEYNMGLGDRRAHAAMDYLSNVGIPTTQLSVISYGKERPICREQNEDCWQKNRRAHLLGMTQDQ